MSDAEGSGDSVRGVAGVVPSAGVVVLRRRSGGKPGDVLRRLSLRLRWRLFMCGRSFLIGYCAVSTGSASG
ncbi:hypothetical protein ACFYUM_23855 [Streptomyces fimicarius]|uniref:hypothetical protein n=1 Tax=Streptomyces griseus TaxID=1911 RepID=UPI0036910294